MPPKKGGGKKKGKNPVKRQAIPQRSPPQSWAMLRELQAKVASMEAKRSERQAPRCEEVTPRRSARESKGKRRAELRKLACELTRRFDAIESEQGREFERQDGGEGTSTAPSGTGGQKRRTEATSNLDAAEGTSWGYDPYDEPYEDTQGGC